MTEKVPSEEEESSKESAAAPTTIPTLLATTIPTLLGTDVEQTEDNPNDDGVVVPSDDADPMEKSSRDDSWSVILQSPSDLASFSPSKDIISDANLHGIGTYVCSRPGSHWIFFCVCIHYLVES